MGTKHALPAMACFLSLYLTACAAGSSGQPASPAPAGVDRALWAMLSAELDTQLALRGTSASRPLTDPALAVDDYAILGREGDIVTATWTYQNPGDYDQNGEVNSADLVVMAKYYKRTTASPDWPAAQLADGNGNGEVEIGDVSVLGQNYGNTLDGYALLVDWGDADRNGMILISDIPAYGKTLPDGDPFPGINGLRWPEGTEVDNPLILEAWIDPTPNIPLNAEATWPDNTPGPSVVWNVIALSRGVLPTGGGPLRFTVTYRVYLWTNPESHIDCDLTDFWASVAAYNSPGEGYSDFGRSGNSVRIPPTS